MRKLNYDLKQLGRRNRDGSRATQAARERILSLVANQLAELGYRHTTGRGLKPKHVDALTARWLEERIAPATMKNRMSAIRWWAGKINKQSVVARSNSHYGIPERVYIAAYSKAQTLSAEQLEAIPDPYLRLSLKLQAEFGLRREEAIKFTPSYADKGSAIVLKPSWTKGGRGREMPVLTIRQREVLDAVKVLAGNGSLIPPEKSYREQLRLYERQTANAGLSKLHGLRHAYAQRRYQELTGARAPIAGGPRRASLAPEAAERDRLARQQISAELGHARGRITSVYLGQ